LAFPPPAVATERDLAASRDSFPIETEREAVRTVTAARSDAEVLAELAAVDAYFTSVDAPEQSAPAAPPVPVSLPEDSRQEGSRAEVLWLLAFLLVFVHSVRG
jgi:hypothetical protein